MGFATEESTTVEGSPVSLAIVVNPTPDEPVVISISLIGDTANGTYICIIIIKIGTFFA